MRKYTYLYILVVFTFLMVCCGRNKGMLVRLDSIDSLMERSPKVAYDSLQNIRRQWYDAVDDELEMKWQLLDTKARNKLFMKLPSDSIFGNVVEYFDKKGSVEEKMLCHYLLGGIYRDHDDAPKAIDCYNYVIHNFDDCEVCCDKRVDGSIYICKQK